MTGHDSASVTSVVPTGAHFHLWKLGFKQSSLGHIARVLRHPALDASRRPPLPWHALVPSRFRVQVNQATQKPPFEFLPAAPGIQRRASRRTPCMRFSRTRLTEIVHRQACVLFQVIVPESWWTPNRRYQAELWRAAQFLTERLCFALVKIASRSWA